MGFLGKNIPGRGNNKHKGHQAGGGLGALFLEGPRRRDGPAPEQGQVAQSSPCRACVITVVTKGLGPLPFTNMLGMGKSLERVEPGSLERIWAMGSEYTLKKKATTAI